MFVAYSCLAVRAHTCYRPAVPESYSVKQTAEIAGIAASTLRAWSKQLAPVLSESATPGPGIERRFNNDDVTIVHTAAVMRQNKQSWPVVLEAIESGDRIMPPDGAPAPGDDKDTASPRSELAAVDLLDRFIVRYESQIDELQTDLANERGARRLAEVEAAELRGRLDRRGFWDRLFRRE